MQNCKRCGSYAINPHAHGRERSVDLHLCDVCYWRKRAEIIEPGAHIYNGLCPDKVNQNSHDPECAAFRALMKSNAGVTGA